MSRRLQGQQVSATGRHQGPDGNEPPGLSAQRWQARLSRWNVGDFSTTMCLPAMQLRRAAIKSCWPLQQFRHSAEPEAAAHAAQCHSEEQMEEIKCGRPCNGVDTTTGASTGKRMWDFTGAFSRQPIMSLCCRLA